MEEQGVQLAEDENIAIREWLRDLRIGQEPQANIGIQGYHAQFSDASAAVKDSARAWGQLSAQRTRRSSAGDCKEYHGGAPSEPRIRGTKCMYPSVREVETGSGAARQHIARYVHEMRTHVTPDSPNSSWVQQAAAGGTTGTRVRRPSAVARLSYTPEFLRQRLCSQNPNCARMP
ncbi:hypothetical protein B0H12DRAFT_1225000 [Mycena haematopus]|nr:hypothetical protein B0H12DRAFT_1225000 [Mycena haematopus]